MIIIHYVYARLFRSHLGLGLGSSPFFLQLWRLRVSSWTVVSSVHTTLLNPFVCDASRYLLAHSNRLTLFASRISWQYALPLNVQPSFARELNIMCWESWYPFSANSFCGWIAVVSSSSSIFLFTISSTSAVILLRRPEPGFH